VEHAEQETIRRALERSGGRKKDAAELLGVTPRALSYYLRKHGIGQLSLFVIRTPPGPPLASHHERGGGMLG
jgi:hypothetical protein